ncbi:MAG: ABC transporter permease [Rhizobiaceae bacterium]
MTIFTSLAGSRAWYGFRSNPLSVAGLVLCVVLVLLAVFAPFVTPFPKHAGGFVNFDDASLPPSLTYWLGTDLVGRDILTRMVFAYRVSFGVAASVLVISVPIGIAIGLAAGYFGSLVETVLMRMTDVFLSIPPLVLAMAILGLLPPNLINAVLALILMWWPWYARLIYSLTRQLRYEGYVVAAEVVGASWLHIMFREILPNCIPSLLTKMSLDVGIIILVTAALGFLGLGVQAPTPELGSMVAEGSKNLPDLWWMAVFPGLGILVAVMGFNLLGDGLKDIWEVRA